MKILSRAYGTIEIEEQQVIDFPNGILGFEDHGQFAFLDAHQKPFYWLQSLVDPQVAFILIKPSFFCDNYAPGIPLEELTDIGAENWEDVIVFAIVTIPEHTNIMTANLQGPIYLNKKSRKGKQYISPKDEYRTRHNILEEMAKKLEQEEKA